MIGALEGVESDDLLNMICGDKIGEGQYRTVFACHVNKDWVVKKEKDLNSHYSNIHEYDLYSAFMDTPLRVWFAPVHWLSPRGLWLIQSRTQSIPDKLLPKLVPSIFCDFKRDNWGMLNGRVVCHDYGNNCVDSLSKTHGKRLQKAAWR